MVKTPTAQMIFEAAEQAIYALLVDGKASASFGGRSYTANDLDKLQRISDIYRQKAANVAADTDPASNSRKVSVSYCNLGGI